MGLDLVLEGPGSMLAKLAQLEDEGLEIGEPRPAGSGADVLDSPLGVDEIRETLEMVAVFISTAGGMAALAKQLKAMFKSSGDSSNKEDETETLVVRNSLTNAELLRLRSAENLDALFRLYSADG